LFKHFLIACYHHLIVRGYGQPIKNLDLSLRTFFKLDCRISDLMLLLLLFGFNIAVPGFSEQ